MPRFNVGDEAWFADCGTNLVKETCAICFGKFKVTLILGDGEHVQLDCDYCSKGFEAPRGYTTTYKWMATPRPVVVTGRRINEGSGSEEVTYFFDEGRFAEDADLFADKTGAEARCAERVAEHDADEARRMRVGKENNAKSYSWHAGYHRDRAKQARRDLEYHEAKVVSMQALARQAKKSEVA